MKILLVFANTAVTGHSYDYHHRRNSQTTEDWSTILDGVLVMRSSNWRSLSSKKASVRRGVENVNVVVVIHVDDFLIFSSGIACNTYVGYETEFLIVKCRIK